MKVDLRKKFWEFVKTFPSTTYAIISIILFIGYSFFGKNQLSDTQFGTAISLLLIPFAPAFLMCVGFGNLSSNFLHGIIAEVAPFFLFIVTTASVDIVTYLIRKTIRKFFDKNLLARISGIILTIILWAIVFVSFINSLPIDT